MSNRICPQCNYTLESFDNYFCSSCGNMLDPILTVPFGITKTYYYYLPSGSIATILYKRWMAVATRARTHVTKKTLFYSFAALFSMIFSFSIYYTLNTVVGTPATTPVKKDIPASSTSGANTLVWEYKLKSSVFGSDTIMEHVPDDVLLYIEGFDYKELSSVYLVDGKKDVEMVTRSGLLLADHFAVFLTEEEKGYAWTGVFIPRDMGLVTSTLEQMDFEHIKFKIIEGKLVVTNNEEVFAKVRNSKSKTALNISLNPKFQLARSGLPKDGQFMLVFLEEKGKEVLEDTAAISSSENLKKMVDDVLKTGYNELVVTGR